MSTRAGTFWSKVRRTSGCWLWQEELDRDGYGRYGLAHGRKAHRVAWVLTHGAIPAGMWVLHRCDIRNCVRPDHLYLGTNLENSRDRSARGRQLRGKDSPLSHLGHRNTPGEGTTTAKLTADQVAEIRRLYSPNPHRTATRMSQRALADRFGVTQQAISKVLLGRTWGPDAQVAEPPHVSGAVISDAEVREIRKRYARGDVSQQQLAAAFGLSQTHVSRIVRGHSR